MNVVPFPLPGLHNIPAMARAFADAVEAGQWGNVKSVLLVCESDDKITTMGRGAADDPYRNVGMFNAAAQMHLNCLEGDE